MSVKVRAVECAIHNVKTRMPFRYGIASMTVVPHLFTACDLLVDGKRCRGIAADHLPPKWFTKDPKTTFRDDLPAMLSVIESAGAIAEGIESAATVFDFWQEIYRAQRTWAEPYGYPPLLWNFGVSLVERAMIGGFCQGTGVSFAEAVRANTLGIRLESLAPELDGHSPADLLPAQPLRTLIARHTVGLSDPLTDVEIPAGERLDDGLPQSLEASIRAYGLTHFKLKIAGDPVRDAERLRRIARVIEANAADDYAFTLDGNEQYTDVAPFRTLWQSLSDDAALTRFLGHLIFVEQPLHRDATLTAGAKDALSVWPERPPIIIDESDGEIDSLTKALNCGYAGTSHKNCKGVFKGILNACRLERLRRVRPNAAYMMSGEDLSNVGPVALLQDIAVLATLGIDHAERNGHHYFRGLTMFPDDVQEAVLRGHPDLYRRHERGFPALDVRHGRVEIGSVVDAPFGVGFDLDTSRFTPLSEWTPASLEAQE